MPGYDEHVSINRLWTFAWLDPELDPDACEHVMGCTECFNALKACLKSYSYATVLRNLGLEDDEFREAS